MDNNIKNGMIHSEITGLDYDPREMVRLVNPKQSATFAIHNAKLYDIYPSRDFKTGEPVWVYLFNRKEVSRLYDLWCRHELN